MNFRNVLLRGSVLFLLGCYWDGLSHSNVVIADTEQCAWMERPTILVTGITGMIGSFLVKWWIDPKNCGLFG